MNKVFIIGRLCSDPSLKFAQGSGTAVASFTIAVDRNFTNQNGQREADFIKIVCFKKQAENVANNLSKGRLVAISGSIRTGSYEAQDGSKRYTTDIYADEVKFLDWPKDGQSQHSGSSVNNRTPEDEGFFPVDDSEIPF